MVGPTASGKSSLAEEMADLLGADVVSADSMQVYRGMDIGTAKPTNRKDRYHLIDLCDPDVDFTVADYQAAGVAVLDDLGRASIPAVIAGGSGLHFRSLVDPLDFPPTDATLRADLELRAPGSLVADLLAADPSAASVVDLANSRRVLRAVEILHLTGATPTERAATETAERVRAYRAVRPFVGIGVDPDEGLAARVVARFDVMLGSGLLEEVGALAPRLGVTAAQAVGYKELLPVVAGEVTLDEGRADAIAATLALAKRQRTFFRRDPRIRWLPWQDDENDRAAGARRVLQEAGVWTS